MNTRVVHPKPTVQDAAIWGGAYLRLDNEDGALTSGELTSVHSLKAQYTNSAADCTKLIHCRWDRKDTRRQNDFEKNWSCPDPSNSSVRDSSLNVLKDLCFEKKKKTQQCRQPVTTYMDGWIERVDARRKNQPSWRAFAPKGFSCTLRTSTSNAESFSISSTLFSWSDFDILLSRGGSAICSTMSYKELDGDIVRWRSEWRMRLPRKVEWLLYGSSTHAYQMIQSMNVNIVVWC